ncbi:hypothetical protein [Asticcacaulis excentricus]|uniref:Uncharacterized protein n=1 Tax=Asticcacaulis excentricus TaxID=78587 RepID=A0A3G9G1Q0_9CAUL|nr:hypothetical protein [Asticcacaulis excentricus]BBF79691.1 hypothetical protein EM6_0260 [Asticcacaulis excentricus]
MTEKVKDSKEFSEAEIAARRDDVVRRMIGTAPKDHPKKTAKGRVGRPIAS